jgi:hypothetical protein
VPRSSQGAGAWSTWVLASGSELRLAPPPGDGDTQFELAELEGWASQRAPAALSRIGYWNTGAPSYRWTEQAVKYPEQGRGPHTR